MLFGLDRRALDPAALELSSTWSPGDRVYLRPHFEISRRIDRELHRRLGTSTVTASNAQFPESPAYPQRKMQRSSLSWWSLAHRTPRAPRRKR